MTLGCKRLNIIFFSCALSLSAFGQDDESAWTFTLDSITVKGYRYLSPLKNAADGTLQWDMTNLGLMPQILGNADPVHYAQMLPGIQTNNEYKSGINIEGLESQHNTVSVFGVPIYNVNHLLGFFSVFNASHFSSMTLVKDAASADMPNRLGGCLDMTHHKGIPSAANGSLSLGLISSQATVKAPIGQKTSVNASLRGSYINMLYGRWLQTDGNQIKYSFYDANATVTHRLNDCNTIIADFYNGNDRAGFEYDLVISDISAKWQNTMGAIHWLAESRRLTSKTSAYVTAYNSRLTLDMTGIKIGATAGITDIGLKNTTSSDKWTAGAEAVWHRVRPQSIEQQEGFNATDRSAATEHSFEGSLFADYKIPIGGNISLITGLRATCYANAEYSDFHLSPSTCLEYDAGTFRMSLNYALRHQYVFQTGFSDMGLPTEYWLTANEKLKPQYAHQFSLGGNTELLERRYRITADVFCHILYNQLGYRGSVLDIANTDNANDFTLMTGKGRSLGFSVMLHKFKGRLTGWLSYTYTHARRQFDEQRQRHWHPANHERPHELNFVGTYSAGQHWSFSATAIASSGTPFTAAEDVYLLGNNVVIKYGEYNGARLKAYFRADVSANYKWLTRKGHEQGVNLSVYNITNRENQIYYHLSTNVDGWFAYKPLSFVVKSLPSVSYYLKF